MKWVFFVSARNNNNICRIYRKLKAMHLVIFNSGQPEIWFSYLDYEFCLDTRPLTFKAAFTFNVTVDNEEFDFDILSNTQPCVLTFLYIVKNIKWRFFTKTRERHFSKWHFGDHSSSWTHAPNPKATQPEGNYRWLAWGELQLGKASDTSLVQITRRDI